MSATVDPPRVLPVDHLSLSSLQQFRRCPEQWRRQRLENEYQPPNGKMVLGSAAGAAESQHFATVIDTGEGFTVEQVLDEFDAEFTDRCSREEVDWGRDKPGELKDSGVRALEDYHVRLVPEIVPVAVERKFELAWPGVDWTVIGFMDVEDADGRVRDMKMRGKRLSQADADRDLQPTMYMAARRAEGNPASGFVFDAMVRAAKPFAESVPTLRTDRQLDRLTDWVFAAARELEWRVLNDEWAGAAPGTWFCSGCGYASDCRFRL